MKTRLAEGDAIEPHQRVLTLKPPPPGSTAIRECDGILRCQSDAGNGPIVVECDRCGRVFGMSRSVVAKAIDPDAGEDTTDARF